MIVLIVIILCVMYYFYFLHRNNKNDQENQKLAKEFFENALQPIEVQSYETYDGGISIKWSKPLNSEEYMTVLKDLTDNSGVKLYFNDDVKIDCIDNTCTYSFENLINNHEYSLSIAYMGVDSNNVKKMSPMSKVLKFMPTVSRMKCNANGTCSIVSKNNVVLENVPITDNNTKKLLSKCKQIVESDTSITDISKIYHADGSFGSVKDELQYPEHLLLPIESGPNSLSELIKKQLDMGILNINIHTKKTT